MIFLTESKGELSYSMILLQILHIASNTNGFEINQDESRMMIKEDEEQTNINDTKLDIT